MNATELKAARKNRGWNQKRLADVLDVSVHTVRAWEQEKNPIPAWVEKTVFSEEDLNLPVDLISGVNRVSTKKSIPFEDALRLVMKAGLSVEDLEE